MSRHWSASCRFCGEDRRSLSESESADAWLAEPCPRCRRKPRDLGQAEWIANDVADELLS